MGYGTAMLTDVAQADFLLEAIVFWLYRATLPLVTASFSLGP